MRILYLKKINFYASKFSDFKSVISLLPFSAIEKRSRTFSLILMLLFNIMPTKLLILCSPKFSHALIANYFLSRAKFDKFEIAVESSQEYSFSRKYSVSMRLDALRDQYLFEEIDDLLNSVFRGSAIDDGSFEAVISWSFWNLSHRNLEKFLLNLKTFLESDFDSSFDLQRYLPDFSRNLGHLACLYMYENFYREHDNREIFIKNNVAANKCYLDLVLKHSHLKINLIAPSEFPVKSLKNIRSFDTLLYSFESQSAVRIESDVSNSFYQIFPEWTSAYERPLRMSPIEYQNGSNMLKEIIGDKWFVILHVREPQNSKLESGQARDSNINTYKLLADYISSNGGVVIRMGNSDLPELNLDFQAYDYAKSNIKNDFLDCWLWENCKYWVGNVNGAMLAALTFGKTRLITNQWYWNLYGGPNDLVLPKLLFKNEVLLTIDETLNSDLSRQMNRDYMKNRGYTLSENTEQEILEGFMDLEKKQPVDNISILDKELRMKLKVHAASKGLMRISPSYATTWTKKLIKND